MEAFRDRPRPSTGEEGNGWNRGPINLRPHHP